MNLPKLSSVKPDVKKKLDDKLVQSYENILDTTSSSTDGITGIEWVMESVGLIDCVLSENECRDIIELMTTCNQLSFWSNQGRDNTDAKSFRDADTIEIHSDTIATIIWKRIEKYLSHLSIHIPDEDDGSETWKVDLPGTWTATGINSDLLFARYPSGGYFSPHTDGHAIHSFNYRSFYSVIIYLNSIPEGGGTKFYTNDSVHHLYQDTIGSAWKVDEKYCLYEVKPIYGRLLCFDQHYVHEGVLPVFPYEKYIIRTDIMFTRSPKLLTTSLDEQAYKIHQEAEFLAENNQVEESIILFRKAYKMSPELARLMGQG